MNREQIHIIARHSDWSSEDIEKALQKKVYPSPRSWQLFIKWACLAIGLSFFVAGIVFFFASNWQHLHKFTKLGILIGAIIIVVSFSLYPKLEPLIRKILLTVASVLTGVLFAVFGQVYQTGANAYEMFLAWMALTMVWVIVAKFPVLWLLYIVLGNITWFTYVAQGGSGYIYDLRFEINAILNFFIFVLATKKPTLFIEDRKIPNWFLFIIAIPAIAMYVAALINALATTEVVLPLARSLGIGLVIGSYLYDYGMKRKSILYHVLVGLSIVLVGMLLIGRFVDNYANFGLYFNSIYVLVSVGAMSIFFLRLVKKWRHE